MEVMGNSDSLSMMYFVLGQDKERPKVSPTVFQVYLTSNDDPETSALISQLLHI